MIDAQFEFKISYQQFLFFILFYIILIYFILVYEKQISQF